MKYHFIGIGGIGISALAKYYLAKGETITGSDIEQSELTQDLERMGIRIAIGPHAASHVEHDTNAVIFNHAIEKGNPERKAARALGIPVRSLAEAIGELTQNYVTIAVAGAHGKSTTTSFLATLLTKAGFDPTVMVGTKLKEFGNRALNEFIRPVLSEVEGSNFRMGRSRYFVLEADEYAGKFLHYSADIAIVTNIDKEHLDYYKNLACIRSAFEKFISRSKTDARIVLNKDDPETRRLGKKLEKQKRFKERIIWYSLKDQEATHIRQIIKVPGIHNISNALAAFRVASILHIPQKTILQAIAEYEGSWRRFEFKGILNGARIFDDYAHHPTEVRATLDAARDQYPKSRIWCIFQPHQRERLRALFADFTTAFDNAHEIIFLDPYEVAGREGKKKKTPKDRASLSFALAEAVDSRMKSNVYYMPYPSELIEFLKRSVGIGDIVIMMGAGNIWKLTEELV